MATTIRKAPVSKITVNKVVKRVAKPAPEWKKDVQSVNDLRDDDEIYAEAVKGTAKVVFSAAVEDFPYSCSSRDLGNFEVHISKADIGNKILKEIIRESLENLIVLNTGAGSCRTIMFTLNGNAHCKMVKEAIQGTDMFTLVKTFKNMNSGNTIELYVNNN